MRTIEIILKLAFVIIAAIVLWTMAIPSATFTSFLIVCALLGIVLIFNKKESYHYPAGYSRMGRVYMMRKFEGIILIAFAIGMYFVIR